MAGIDIPANLRRMSHRIRTVVAAHRQLAGEAGVAAANQTLVKNIRSRLTKDPRAEDLSHRWKDRLYDSVTAEYVMNAKSVSLKVSYKGVPHADSFEQGGRRHVGGGPDGVSVDKLAYWVLGKRSKKGGFESVKNLAEARKVAKRVMKKLINEGATPYPILSTAWKATQDSFVRQYLQRLNAIVLAVTR